MSFCRRLAGGGSYAFFKVFANPGVFPPRAGRHKGFFKIWSIPTGSGTAQDIFRRKMEKVVEGGCRPPSTRNLIFIDYKEDLPEKGKSSLISMENQRSKKNILRSR